MRRAWEPRFWQQMSVDGVLARGYKTCLLGSVLWVSLVILNLWATYNDTRVVFYQWFDSPQSKLSGIPEVAAMVMSLGVIGLTVLFAALLYSGQAWCRWILLAQGVFPFLICMRNIFEYGLRRYFSSYLFSMPNALAALVAYRNIAAFFVPLLLLALFAWLSAQAPRHYFRRLAELKREAIYGAAQPSCVLQAPSAASTSHPANQPFPPQQTPENPGPGQNDSGPNR